jgi:hypothetical protein
MLTENSKRLILRARRTEIDFGAFKEITGAD